MKSHQLPKLNKKAKRLGRGNASGLGTTSGRGTKGQRSRTSRGNIPRGFEGGQTALKARLPKKRGFRNFKRVEYQIVNLDSISKKFKTGAKVDKKSLLANNLIKNLSQPVKILGKGDIDKKIEVSADAFSASAKDKITKAGGKTIFKEKE